VNVASLVDELRVLGVSSGELLMVHASLRALGLARSQGVEGGAEILLTALSEAVGPEGTLMMILGSEYPLDHVNQYPISERAALLEGTEPFHYLEAPVLPEVGWIAEAFRRRPGTLVSENPSGRFAACGARASELLRDQPWNDYYGPGSPLEKLCAWGGRVLRLGANPDTTTVLHYAEYLARISGKRRTRWDYLLATPEGPRHRWIECLDDAEGIVDWDGEDYFAVILKAYLAQGRHFTGKIGATSGDLMKARDLAEFGARWMEENLSPSGAPLP
jgi:aminoglycoside N3'-acetyltransferase